MMSWLLKLLGVRNDSSGRIVEAVLALRNGGSLGWVILAAIVLGVMTVWLYRRASEVGGRKKHVLACLRIVLLVLLLLLLLRPVVMLTIEGSIRRALVMLIDNSSSMTIEDARTTELDRKRAGIVLEVDDIKSNQLDHPPRIDLVKGALAGRKLNLLKKLGKDFDLRFYTFGPQVSEIESPETRPWASAASPMTPLGDALRDVLAKSRGQPLAGIFLITDGQSNSGSAPIAAAESAALQSVPIYPWGVGLAKSRDVIVGSVFAPEVCFVRDDVPVVVRVRGSGLSGQSGQLVLKLGEKKMDETAVSFDNDAEQVVSLKIKPDQAGEFEIEASIAPRNDEVVKDNNRAVQKIRAVDGRLKVLLVDQQPRWEFKYLQTLLLRDRRIDLKCYLVEADAAVSRDEKSPFLSQFPRTKEELFKFDSVILGDVDPKGLSGTQIEWLADFVSKFGGGMVMLAGKRFGPDAWRGSLIEKMLPVEFDPTARSTSIDLADKPIRLEPTTAGDHNPMLRLSDQPVESKRLWANLPPIFWEFRVQRAKPAAEVLLVDPDPAKSYRGAKMPVLALQQYGLGQVLYCGTDNTWRWRKNVGDKYYATLWGQIVQRMSLPHLLGESKRTQLTSDRKNYVTGDRVTIYARLYDETYAPISDPLVRGGYKNTLGKETEVTLRSLPDQPGMYRGEFVAPGAGSYQFAVQRDLWTQLQIDVAEPHAEMGESTMNEPLLQDMARVTGGAFLHEDDLSTLADRVKSKTELVRSKREIDLWASPLYFLLIVAIAGAEWALRKMWQLK